MVEIDRQTFTVVTTGVGRPDYSQNVEYSVEPMIRSWQNDYRHFETLDVNPGPLNDTEIDIDLDEETVVMLYDFYLSAPRNMLLNLLVEALEADGVTWGHVAQDSGYQKVEIHLSRGFPVLDRYRVTATNLGNVVIECLFSAHGIVTAETTYYGSGWVIE